MTTRAASPLPPVPVLRVLPEDAPTIITERMILRMPVMADAEPYMAILMSDRALYLGGPMDARTAWLDFASEVANWTLHGFGPFTMEERRTGRFLGLAILHHTHGDPERELGWVITDDAEGQGLAKEAAAALRDHAFQTLGWDSMVSYIAPENTRSICLAEALGALRDDAAQRPRAYPDCLVYRHIAPEVTHG